MFAASEPQSPIYHLLLALLNGHVGHIVFVVLLLLLLCRLFSFLFLSGQA